MGWKFFTVLILVLAVGVFGINFVSPVVSWGGSSSAYYCATSSHWWDGQCSTSLYDEGCMINQYGQLLSYLTVGPCEAGYTGEILYIQEQDTQGCFLTSPTNIADNCVANPTPQQEPAPTVSLNIWPGYDNNVAYGGYKLVEWSSTNAVSCSAPWTSSSATSYSTSIGPVTQDTTYSITCTGPGGNASDSLSLTVYPVCGDGSCNLGEITTSCVSDCHAIVLCGNGVNDSSVGETCDWGDASTPSPNNGDGCTNTYGSTTACTYCSNSCTTQTNSTGLQSCGDGIVTSPNEQCDGSNLNGQTCQSLNYQSGILSCYPASSSSECTFDKSNCVPYPSGGDPVCGNGQVESGEACDEGGNNGECPATCNTSCTTNSCGGGGSPPPGGGSPPPVVCTLTSATWSTSNTTEGNTVSLQVQGSSACSGQTVSFVAKEYDVGSTDDPVQTNPVNVVFSGNLATGSWVTEWQDDGPLGGDPEYYFTATVSGVGSISSGTSGSQLLTVTKSNVLQCNQATTCSDYKNVETCTLDQCRVADNSVPGQVDCGTGSGTGCFCFWDETLSSCKALVDGPAGTCVYTQSTADDCGDGFLIFSWTANWTWKDGKTIADDTNKLSLACVDGSKTVECPAQIALPFFSAYNAIVILVAIVLIYWAMSRKKMFGRSKGNTRARKKRI